MATTVKARKAKGRALQNEIRDAILEAFPLIPPDDVKVAIMGETGVDIHLSLNAKRIFGNWAIECKAQESLNIWGAMEQAKANALEEIAAPVLFFKRNRSSIYVVLRKEDFFDLVKR